MPFNPSAFHSGTMNLGSLYFPPRSQSMPEVLPMPPATDSSIDMETVKKYAPYALGAMALLYVLTR